jgi:hypothetical protein
VAEHSIFQAFKEADCESLVAYRVQIGLTKSTTSRVLACMKGKRKRFPVMFAAAYPGPQKRKVGLSVRLERLKGVQFSVNLRWFVTEMDPPPNMGKVSDLFDCVAPVFGEREVDFWVTFVYDTEKVGSIFRPIRLDERTTIFDEIVSFAGAKHDPEGKHLYTLDVALGQRRLTHVVQFKQAVKLAEDLPLSVIPRAKTISALALGRGGE